MIRFDNPAGSPLQTSTRRDFMLTTAAAAATLAATPLAGRAIAGQSTEPKPVPAAPSGKPSKTLLILGGTAFLGPEVVDAARAKGWTITLFNRGKTRPELFPDLEKLKGDRDPDKDGGLSALKGRTFDAVIDNSGYFPRHVKASAELLAPNTKHYVFISTLSVYKDNAKADMDERDELGTIADPNVETMGDQQQNYGPLKALCEQAAEKAMPGRVTNIRPGYIVGPGDWSGRFNYWPLRIREAKAGTNLETVLAPGTPDDAVQVIDVRDLADFAIRCIESATFGIFNATGPKEKLAWGSCLEACRRVTKSDAKLTWVPWEFLEKHQKQGDYFPICLPPAGETAGFHRRSNARAVAAGLTFRPLETTIDGLLKWYDALKPEQQKRFRAGVSHEREAELLAEWGKGQK